MLAFSSCVLLWYISIVTCVNYLKNHVINYRIQLVITYTSPPNLDRHLLMKD